MRHAHWRARCLRGALSLCLLLCFAAGAITLRAQTVRPAVVELTAAKHGNNLGHFDVVNDSLEPVVVTVEAKSFTIARDGRAVFRPLDAEIHLELSETSLRLSARQSRTVYYRVTAPHYPAWFCVYSNFTPARRRPGMQVQLELPHTVYLAQPGKISADALRITDVHRSGNDLTAVVRNTGGSVQRVTSVQLLGGHDKQELPGFPLLPDGERELTLTDVANADTLRLNTATSHVNQSLARSTP